MLKKTLLAGLVALPAITLTACDVPEDSATKSAAPVGKPDMTVAAGVILKDFEENELAADNKYKGKVLKITGKVDKIDTELLNDKAYILDIRGNNQYAITTVSCHGVPAKQMANLKVGQPVTAIGRFKDGGDLGIEVEDCHVA